MSKLKYRIALILALIVASLWALFPRTAVERVFRDGQFVFDTVQRVPLKRGLDLQGGIHLALELDESRGVIQDKSAAIEQAIRVIRNRIDQFGVAEPVVQQEGDDRIVVELPGVDDPVRAQQVLSTAAFLEFQITDETNALERVVPRLDQIARDLGLAGAATAAGDTARSVPGLGGLLRSGADSAADSTAADTAGAAGGPFSRSLRPGQFPGRYLVAIADEPLLRRLLDTLPIQNALPPGKEVRWAADTVAVGTDVYRELWVLDARPIITGEYITDARPQQDPAEGAVVAFTLNAQGARRFRTET